MAHDPTKSTRGYPLIALFLVVTACGVVAALVGPAIRGIFEGGVGLREAVTASMICSILIMLLGGMIGLFHYHRGRGFLWGLLVGTAVGIFVGPMILAPRSAIGTMFGLSVGGAAVIVFVAAAFRLSTRLTPVAPRK